MQYSTQVYGLARKLDAEAWEINVVRHPELFSSTIERRTKSLDNAKLQLESNDEGIKHPEQVTKV